MTFNPRDLHNSTGSNRYLVRLVFEAPADTPEIAALKVIEQVAAFGLRNWIYRVQDMDTEETFSVNGFGELTDLEGTPLDPDDAPTIEDIDPHWPVTDEGATPNDGATPGATP